MAYQNQTLLDLQTALAEKFEQQPFWSADNARRAINEGLRIYNLITGMYREATVIPLVPDDTHVYVGGTLVKGTRLVVSGRTLTLTSINALDKMIANWQGVNTASGSPTPALPSFWCPVGLTEVQIYPKIDPSLLGLTTTVDGVRNTPLLVNPGDFLNMGNEEISSLLGYALHVLCFAKGAAALQKTMPLRAAFFKACALRNATFEASSLYRKIIGYDRLRSGNPMVDQGAMQRAGDAFQALGEGVGGGGAPQVGGDQ